MSEASTLGPDEGAAHERVETPTFHLGRPTRDLDQALRLAAELEDAEIMQELEHGR